MTTTLAASGAAVPAAAELQAPPLFRWYPVAAPEPRAGSAKIGQTLVVGGDAASRARVASELTSAGARATVADFSGESEAELLAEAEALVAETGPVDGIVDLGVAGDFTLSDPGPWRAALRQTVAVLKAVYDDWAAETDANRLFYVAITRMGGRMGYSVTGTGTGVAQPLGGIWAGLAKSLPQELPNCRVKVVDLEATADPAPYVVRELRCWDLFEIGWQAGDRGTLAAGQYVTGPDRLDLSPADSVVLSGGGRGLGFALAHELASRFGCRVLVSGRHPLPSGEEWAGLSDEEFGQREHYRLRAVPAGLTVREVRADTERRRARREALHNLEAARRAGLRIEYHTGDITDPAFAKALVDAAGPELRVVVHNAGIASPTRLRNKSVASFLATIETKVDGFLALLTALGDRRVDYFCNVGSVSGRLGGMIGQIDYAAANEALARLGFWAGQPEAYGQPVATICWPTWQQLGLIANFGAALRYAEALGVDSGVGLWTAQIAAAEPGEVMVLGRIGRAVSPGQLKGFANFRDHPDTHRLQSLEHYLGEVEAYAPFRSIRARTRLTAGAHPCLAEFTVDGVVALPVSLALEYALALAGWVSPEGFPELWLRGLREVVVAVPRLAFEDGSLELVKSAEGRTVSGGWEVAVSVTDGTGRNVLSAVAEYALTPPSETPDSAVGGSSRAGTAIGGGGGNVRLGWAGVLYRPANWRRDDDGSLAARIAEVPSSDEWTLPVPPERLLPHNAIESILRARAGHPIGTIRIAEVGIGTAPANPVVHITGSPDLTHWRVTNNAHQCVLALTGLERTKDR